jgi:hypothetical protein
MFRCECDSLNIADREPGGSDAPKHRHIKISAVNGVKGRLAFVPEAPAFSKFFDLHFCHLTRMRDLLDIPRDSGTGRLLPAQYSTLSASQVVADSCRAAQHLPESSERPLCILMQRILLTCKAHY